MMQIVQRIISFFKKGAKENEEESLQEYLEGDAPALRRAAEKDGATLQAYEADGVTIFDVSHLDGIPEFELIDPPDLPVGADRRRTDREEELASKRATIEARKRIKEERMSGNVTHTIQAHSDGRAEYRR